MRFESLALAVTPSGQLSLEVHGNPAELDEAEVELAQAFEATPGAGLLWLATGAALTAPMPPSLAFARELAKTYMTRLCATPGLEAEHEAPELEPPVEDLVALAGSAPPMTGGEYLTLEALEGAWAELEQAVADELEVSKSSVAEFVRTRGSLWNVVGRVWFHLAENKRDPEAPFAFLATQATGLSKGGKVQHAPLGRAVTASADARERDKLLALLEPVHRAAEASEWLRAMVDSGEVFHPLAWSPEEALAFLREIPVLEASGVVVRVPELWKSKRPPRPTVQVKVGAQQPAGLGLDAILDVNVGLTLEGEPLSEEEKQLLLNASSGLVLLKGKWVEVDREKLGGVIEHWNSAIASASRDGVTFAEAMRMLANVPEPDAAAGAPAASAEWSTVTAGPWLDAMLAELSDPAKARGVDPGDRVRATLRPYQREGVAWLLLLARLRLGACLADDMGLGKTLQVIALITLLREQADPGKPLLVLPASLLGNWQAELAKFAPGLKPLVAHPSAMAAAQLGENEPAALAEADVVLTTYGTVGRAAWLRARKWGLVVLDEAQAIKNPAAQQTRAVKALESEVRVCLTGTPVENRLGDLWSIFDFLNPGLLGGAKEFKALTKGTHEDGKPSFGPLRALVRPYILRRMKSDKRIVSDLPDKTELLAWCSLTRAQAALYERAVEELAKKLESSSGIERRGLVLAYLLRLKQICNHPSQWLGDGEYAPGASGKLARLRELCEPIAARQEKVLVFTQFREMTEPLARYLADVFGKPGLVLSGTTAVKKRQELVANFQDPKGPPFFVLSLKAGGTGLNLTAASHVIHFDRWWNPAVENQATDRAYRIGQHRNVLVHKFVCKGTIEERIDALITAKRGLSDELFAGGEELSITEMSRDELLALVSLDAKSALGAAEP